MKSKLGVIEDEWSVILQTLSLDQVDLFNKRIDIYNYSNLALVKSYKFPTLNIETFTLTEILKSRGCIIQNQLILIIECWKSNEFKTSKVSE